MMPLSSFVGRAEATEDVVRRVQLARLVTLTGAGGVGKSRLALEVASLLSGQGHTVALIDLAALPGPTGVLPAVATALGLPGGHNRSRFESVVRTIGQNRLLLVLDGCERLRSRCADLAADLLGACSGLRILASSRERLGAAGEAVCPVPPLSLPAVGPPRLPDVLVASEAVQLFCERAAALRRGFLPTSDNVDAIVEICRRLDGNPLAIELAAGRIVALPPAEIAIRLADRFALLRGGPRTAPARQRTLRASLDWDFERLSLSQQVLLARLSVFPGAFGVVAVEGVCAGGEVEARHVLELLSALVDKSLVVDESTACAARFRLSETVRVYAAERLEDAGSRTLLAERHASWRLALAEAQLTPAERRVAVLAAQGSPSADIARELVVSRRTVETHLQRTYAKLGIGSRKQLGRYLRGDDEPRT